MFYVIIILWKFKKWKFNKKNFEYEFISIGELNCVYEIGFIFLDGRQSDLKFRLVDELIFSLTLEIDKKVDGDRIYQIYFKDTFDRSKVTIFV